MQAIYPSTGRTRWRRIPILLVPAFVGVAALMIAIASGALAINVAISGMPFKLSASQITASRFVQYAQPDHVTNADSPAMIDQAEQSLGDIPRPGIAGFKDPNGGAVVADTVTAMHNAKIYDLYQTVCAPIPLPVFPNLQVTIKAGTNTPASADNMLVNSPAMKADEATFHQIQIGADVHQALTEFGYPDVFSSGVLGPGAAPGNFSQAADSVVIKNVNQVGTATAANTFTLPDLRMSARFVSSCP